MNVRIGTGPDSWGVWFADDPKQIPWKTYLDEVVSAGYTWTELGPYGYLPPDAGLIRTQFGDRGLKLSGSFIMTNLEKPDGWPEVERQLVETGEMIAHLGGRYLVLIDETYSDLFTGKLRGPRELDDSAWKRLVKNTHKVARIAKERFQLDLVFHPHADTHVEYEPQIEKLLEDTDPSLVSLCLDTGHHAYRGGDPVRFFLRHHKRIRYLHLKSVDSVMQKKVENEGIPFAVAVGMDLFCEPSVGVVDFPAFRDALEKVNYDGWATVEQDMYPAPFGKPLPIALRTRGYLQSIGIG